MTFSDSDIGSNNIVIWDIGISEIGRGTMEILSDRECDIGIFKKIEMQHQYPPTRALMAESTQGLRVTPRL